MLLRKILILPIVVFGAIAFFSLITGDFFHFYLWSFLAGLVSIAFVPLLTNQRERAVPIVHVFGTFIIFILLSSIVVFFDLRQSEAYSFVETLVYGIFIGIGVVAMIMTLKGK